MDSESDGDGEDSGEDDSNGEDESDKTKPAVQSTECASKSYFLGSEHWGSIDLYVI